MAVAPQQKSALELKEEAEVEATNHAFKNGLFFSMLVIFVPIFLYFFTKTFLFEGIFGYSNSTSYLYAAIVAVVSVQALLFLFIYVAWKEEKRPRTYKVD